MSLNTRQYDWAAGRGLRQISPGFYVDETGAEYFYLSGLYACVAHRLLTNPLLNTPAFVANVLIELRCALETSYCTELMD